MTSPPDAEQRFQRLYARHHADILGYVARRIGYQDAPDVAADVFLVAWRRIDDLPTGEAARPWLFGVARKVVLNRRRSTRRFWRFWERYRFIRTDAPAEPDVLVVKNSEHDDLLAALDRLRPAERELLRLVTWEELPYAEVAEVLGCSRHAVDQRVARARRHLARALRANGQAWDGGKTALEDQVR